MYPSPRNPTPPRAETYDRWTICLHWLTAALVATLCIIPQVIDDFPRSKLRIRARSAHIILGVLLALVVAQRMTCCAGCWGGKRPSPAARSLIDDAIRWKKPVCHVVGRLGEGAHGRGLVARLRLPLALRAEWPELTAS